MGKISPNKWTEKHEEEMKLMFSQFHTANLLKVSETRWSFTCAVRGGREYSQLIIDKLVHFINER